MPGANAEIYPSATLHMPGRGRPQVRKITTTSHAGEKVVADPSASNQTQKNKSATDESAKMPPPPPPVPTTILGPEMKALERSLREAALNTAKIFRFYADTKKERIASYAPYPPRSITLALGRSIERYDQVCDTIETVLLHAISVLERDLKAEHARIEAEASASVATRTRSKRPSVSPTITRVPLPSTSPPPGSEQMRAIESPTLIVPLSQFPPAASTSAISLAARRPSAILSSLHRPGFPLKLDLSPAVLAAGNVDSSAMGQPMDVNVDLGLTSLPSPVTLAPKTARMLPNDASLPDIFSVSGSQGIPTGHPDSSVSGDTGPLSGTVGMKTSAAPQADVIDLTGPEPPRREATQLGDSADKPIELDLEGSYDEMDLFGDVQTNNHTANTTHAAPHTGDATAAQQQLGVDMDNLFTPEDNQPTAFQLDEAMRQNEGVASAPDPGAILASLAANASSNENSNELASLLPADGGQSGNSTEQSLQGHASGVGFPGVGSDPSTESQFDLSSIDLSSFSGLFDASGDGTNAQVGVGGEEEIDLMSQLLAMDGGAPVNPSTSEGGGSR